MAEEQRATQTLHSKRSLRRKFALAWTGRTGGTLWHWPRRRTYRTAQLGRNRRRLRRDRASGSWCNGWQRPLHFAWRHVAVRHITTRSWRWHRGRGRSRRGSCLGPIRCDGFADWPVDLRLSRHGAGRCLRRGAAIGRERSGSALRQIVTATDAGRRVRASGLHPNWHRDESSSGVPFDKGDVRTAIDDNALGAPAFAHVACLLHGAPDNSGSLNNLRIMDDDSRGADRLMEVAGLDKYKIRRGDDASWMPGSPAAVTAADTPIHPSAQRCQRRFKFSRGLNAYRRPNFQFRTNPRMAQQKAGRHSGYCCFDEEFHRYCSIPL